MKFRNIIIASLSVVLFSSCKKWLDINEDPVNPQVATGEVLLSPLQFQMANNVIRDSRFVGKYVQFWGNQAVNDQYERHGYVLDISDLQGDIWRMLYFNMGRNLELLIQDGIKNEKHGFVGIGYAIKAWAYQIGTDYHGPLILTDAFPENENQYVFTYDEQEVVYPKVREWCHLSVEYLNKTGGKDLSSYLASATGDQIYKGDLNRWRKFTYGVLALHFSHLTTKPEFAAAYADSVIKYADLAFSSAADDPSVYFNASVTAENNPINTLTNSTAYRIGYPIVALLSGGVRGTPRFDTLRTNGTTTTSADPRLSRMLTASADNVFRGVVATDGDPNAANTRAVRALNGKYTVHDKARFPIMSYAQVQFAKAEAAFIKNNKALAHTAYLNGIRGHMDFVNAINASTGSTQAAISAAEITTYMASSEVAQNAASLTLKDIMLQKFIAQWGWAAIEQWTDMRKYKYDTNLFVYYNLPTMQELWPDNLRPDGTYKLVQRVRPRYNSEYLWNRAALEKVGALNLEYHTKEMWFAKP
jgi:hypothetical protein